MTAPGGTAPFAFVAPDACHGPLDRADHLRTDAAALATLWPQARVLQLDAEGRAVGGVHGAPATIAGADLRDDPGDAVFLGVDSESRGWFCAHADADAFDVDGRIDLRSAAATWPATELSAFATARALQHWRARHRHCGACGSAVLIERAGWLGRCEGCGVEHYPRTDPAVIVAVGEGSRLLMGRQRSWPARRYSVIAGFVEPGETLEQAVAREVLEETGVRVIDCRYVASQPWPFPSALMLGFIATAAPGDVHAGDELEHARWFERAEIDDALAAEAAGDPERATFLLPARISIAHALVRAWLATQAN